MAQTTRDKLLQVATELVWQESYGSVSVDQICDRAGVNKGSFYHFFPSKSDLAVAAFEEHWQKQREVLDRIFSAQSLPLERLRNYCDATYLLQLEKKKQTGKVLGCPYASIGCEMSTQDEKVRRKAEEIFRRVCRYLESALRDAHAEGTVPRQDFAERAGCIYSFVLGKLLEAKVKNDVEVLRDLYPTVMQVIGTRS